MTLPIDTRLHRVYAVRAMHASASARAIGEGISPLATAAELRAFLAERFSDAELRSLAFDLQIPWEDLGGGDIGKDARIQALIEWCNRRNRLNDLHNAATAARSEAAKQRRKAPVSMSVTDWNTGQVNYIDRLMDAIDELKDDVAKLMTKLEVQNQRLWALERNIDRLNERQQPLQPVTWQMWVVAVMGLLMAVALIYSVGQLLLGGH